MTINPELINLGIPLAICVISALPFIFIPELGKNEENDSKYSYYYPILYYLLFLGLLILVLIIGKSFEIMSFDNGNRTIFICAVLLVACLDRIIDLWSPRITLKSSLVCRLHYFVILLCTIPILWQLLIHIIPPEISGQQKIMSGAEIFLMFIMLTLGMINRPARRADTHKKQLSFD